MKKIRETDYFANKFHQDWILNMIEMLPKKKYKNCLDIGSGNCIIYPKFKQYFPETKYLGLDVSKKDILKAKIKYLKYKNFNAIIKDGNNLNDLSDEFDLIFSRGGIHHLSNPKNSFIQCRNKLKNKGIIIISEPTSNYLLNCLKKIIYKTKHFDKDHHTFEYKQLQNLLIDVGYKIIKKKRYGLFSHVFGYPDIIKINKLIPNFIKNTLFKIDKILIKYNLINYFAFSSIIIAEKNE